MKVTDKKIENYEATLTIEVEAAELEKTKKQACKKLANRVSIPGFRKGKAPQHVIENHLGKGAILDEAADMLIQKSSQEAMKEEKLSPVTEPQAKIVTCEDGKDFVFTLSFTPYPEVKIGEYKNIDVEKVVEPVTDEEVDDEIKHMREHHANMIEVAEDATVEDGDFITLNFSGSVDGEKFEGGTAEDYPLRIGSHSFIDNFEDQLIGLKVGDEKEVKVTFPEDYHDKDLADKKAVFECKINSIKRPELPALDEEFVKKVSKFKTVDEFKADIRKNMETNAERRAVEKQHSDVIAKVVEGMTVDVPPVMIEDRITQMIAEFEARIQMNGIKFEQYLSMAGKDMDQLREEYRKTAEENVHTDLMLEEVANKEDIKVTGRDLDYEVAVMAQMYRTNPKQVAKFLRESGQLINLMGNVRRRKAAQFILDNMAGAEKPEEIKPAESEKVEDKKSE